MAGLTYLSGLTQLSKGARMDFIFKVEVFFALGFCLDDSEYLALGQNDLVQHFI